MQVQLIEPETRRPHFRHRGGVCGFYTEGDEEEHEDMKHVVYQWLQNIGVEDADYEVRVGRNIADIYSPRLKLAVEVQFSWMSREDFTRRTRWYSVNGVHVLWLFHIKFLSFGSGGTALLRSEALGAAYELYRGRVYFLDQYAGKVYVAGFWKYGEDGRTKVDGEAKYFCAYSVLDLARPASYRDVLGFTISSVDGVEALVAVLTPPRLDLLPCHRLGYLVDRAKERLEREKEARRRPASP